MIEYPWMEIAREKLGIHEIPGPKANAFIVECLKSTTIGWPDNLTDATAWCSAFVNRIMQLAGHKGTNSAWARSWLEWGRMSFWIKNSLATSTDTFRIEAGYLAADYSIVPLYSQVIDLNQAGTHYDDWTQLWFTPYRPAPAGAVSAYFKFKVGTGASDGNGITNIDDVQINMWIK
jgi:hypothetical protein